MQKCVCTVDVGNSGCKPTEVTSMLKFFKTLEDLKIYSLFGPKHKEQVDAICTKLGANDSICCSLRKVVANFPQVSGTTSTIGNRSSTTAPVRGEISVKQYFHLW